MEAQEADTDNRDGDNISREDFGKMLYGCEHYRRRCKIRAPCCDKIFTCRHCHNEATNALSNPKERHEIVRQDVKQVVCAVCATEQQVASTCSNCGVKFGEYFCDICKFYDDDQVGGRENFFHCQKCGSSNAFIMRNLIPTMINEMKFQNHYHRKFFHLHGKYHETVEIILKDGTLLKLSLRNENSTPFVPLEEGSCYGVSLHNNHLCVEDSMKGHCPICYEFLFDSTKQTTILKCGHTMHMECYDEMLRQHQYRCPICSKSVLDMSGAWERLDQEIEATAMPEEYRREVQILCNDCNNRSTASFHIFGHKCRHCSSYNTRVITSEESHER
ncbi:hypothetical protein OROHE_025746 [Orobanche hederae]